MFDTVDESAAPASWLVGDALALAEALAALTELPIGELDADATLSLLGGLERLKARLDAEQVKALARFAALRPGKDREFAPDELAVELCWTSRGAAGRIGLAEVLAERLPATLAALERGAIDLPRARVLAELTLPLSDEHARQVEDRVLPNAAEQNPSQLRQATRRAVIKVDPAGAEARHRQAKTERRVGVEPRADGMADLAIFGAAPDVAAAYSHIDALARATRAAGDERTLDEIRADTALDLLTGRWAPTGPGPAGAGTAGVHVVVPVGTLLGLTDEPAELAGYGPIPASMARDIAADATWRRLLTDPATGTLLDYGTTTYRPPATLAGYVRARDGRCVFPGCRRPARGCDLDHTQRHPQGRTSHCNLGCLCRHHHRCKHRCGWTLTQPRPGRFVWITPTGRTYTREEEPPIEPPPPPEPADPGHDPPPF